MKPAYRHWAPAVVGAGVAAAAIVGAGVAIATTDNVSLQGALVAVAAFALAVGLASTAHRLRPVPGDEEAREPYGYHGYPRVAADPGRRRLLGRAAVGAVVVAGGAAVIPLRSLSVTAERRRHQTAWAPGVRLVDERNAPLRGGDALEVGGFTTVWPEGSMFASNSQTLLIRLRPGSNVVAPGRPDWTVLGYVAYSKLCTHMGCPVGLYQETSDVLVCPCHQGVFDVLRGATPVQGPVPRPLPQLPLGLDADGYLAALGDFPDAVGPGFWSRPR